MSQYQSNNRSILIAIKMSAANRLMTTVNRLNQLFKTNLGARELCKKCADPNIDKLKNADEIKQNCKILLHTYKEPQDCSSSAEYKPPNSNIGNVVIVSTGQLGYSVGGGIAIDFNGNIGVSITP